VVGWQGWIAILDGPRVWSFHNRSLSKGGPDAAGRNAWEPPHNLRSYASSPARIGPHSVRETVALLGLDGVFADIDEGGAHEGRISPLSQPATLC